MRNMEERKKCVKQEKLIPTNSMQVSWDFCIFGQHPEK